MNKKIPKSFEKLFHKKNYFCITLIALINVFYMHLSYGLTLLEGANGSPLFVFELPSQVNAVYTTARINGSNQQFTQISPSILKQPTDDDPSVVYSFQTNYNWDGSGEFCYRIQANGNGEHFLPGPGVPNLKCFNEYAQSEPPSGRIDSVPQGNWSGTETITGSASHPDGRVRIEVFIDGELAGTGAANGNGNFRVDVTTNQGSGEPSNVVPKYSNGQHTVKVDAVSLFGGRVTLGEYRPTFANSTFLPSVIVTDFAIRFRLRHEGEQRAPQSHDRFDETYDDGDGYYWGKITDYEDRLVIQTWNFPGRPSVGNCVMLVRPNSHGEVPTYTVGCPAVSGGSDGASHQMEITELGGKPWSQWRQEKALLHWEYTTGPWYSSIMRYRSGQGGFGWKYEDPQFHSEAPDLRYYSGDIASSNPVSGDGLEFSQEFNGINKEQLGEFLDGRVLFRENFIENGRGGGPGYNAESCLHCHINGTRGQGGEGGVGLIVRTRENYGDAFHTQGSDAEGELTVSGTLAGPNGLSRPNYQLMNLRKGSPGDYEIRMAPQLPGLGLLEAIPDATLRQWASEGSGRIHETPNGIGRFGWKASTASIREQVAKAYRNDMGVTNPLFPSHDGQGGNSPEINNDELNLVTAYIQGLGIPVRRHPNVKYGLFGTNGGRLNPEPQTLSDPVIERGDQVFNDIGCATCHRPEVKTGNDHPYPQFRNLTIRPYTDLLLHDMGPDLAGISEGNATATEWRTPPLWGTRLLERLQENSNFSDAQLPFTSGLNKTSWLHDGRANSRDEAIRWHGGEAEAAKNAYLALSNSDRSALIQFLRSL